MEYLFRYHSLIVLFYLLVITGGCQDASPATTTKIPGAIAAPLEHKDLAEEALKINDTSRSDSVAKQLMPILLTDPITRDLENWFALSQSWKNTFGTTEKLLSYAALVFDNFQKQHDLVNSSRVKNSIARIHHLRGNYSQAIEEMHESLNLAREAGDSTSVGWAISGLAAPYLQSGDFSTAYQYLQRAIVIGENTNNVGIQCINKLNLATYYGFLNRLDTAAIIMQEATTMAKEHRLKAAEIFAQLNSAVFFTYDNKFDEAVALLKEDFGLDRNAVTIPNAMLNFNLYEAYLGRKDYDLALASLNKGCALADSLDFGFGISFCAESLADYYEQTGNAQMALMYYKEYQKIKEKQVGEEVAQKIQSLQTKQTIKEKDWEIERLQAAELDQQASYNTRRNLLLYLIFGLIVFSVAFFAIAQSRHRVKSAYQSKTIAETKLQVLQSQMNPHFIYNAITGIQNYILKSEKIEAYSYLGKFADLLRMITKSSQDTRIRLDQEIEMIRTYLDLEKLRFREDFVYEINVSEDLLNENPEVASMMVQPVVENAILHGLSGLSRQGKLTITYEKYEEGIKCTVTDNGRGREAATEIAQKEADLHLSIASINIRERLKFLREIGYTTARTKVEDLYDNGLPAGTTVCIYLPILTEKTTLS